MQKKITDLATVKSKPQVPSLKMRINAVAEGLAAVAKIVAGPATPTQMMSVMSQLKSWSSAVSDIEKIAKKQILLVLQMEGEKVTDKGSLRLEKDGVRFEARPHRTGVDPKKLEALLRAKKLNVEGWMTPTITYKVNEENVVELRTRGIITPAEYAAIQYETTMVVQQPTPVAEEVIDE